MKCLIFLSVLVAVTVARVPFKVPKTPYNVTFYDKKMDYESALKFCKNPLDDKTELLEINHMGQNAWIYSEMKKRGIKRLWIGYTRRRVIQDHLPKEHWAWESGITATTRMAGQMTFWGPGEPNNFRNHNERCAEIRDLPKNDELHNWNDRPCHHLNNFACMRRGY